MATALAAGFGPVERLETGTVAVARALAAVDGQKRFVGTDFSYDLVLDTREGDR